MAQFVNSRKDQLPIPGNAVAIHVASQYNKAKLCQPHRLFLGMVIETGTRVNDQNPRTIVLHSGI